MRHWPVAIDSSNCFTSFDLDFVPVRLFTGFFGVNKRLRRITGSSSDLSKASSSSLLRWRLRRIVLHVKFSDNVAVGASVDSFSGEAGGDGGSYAA